MTDGDEREDAIARAWARLERHEAAHPGQPYATALRLRRAKPKASLSSLARELGERTGSTVTTSDFRKIAYDAQRTYLDAYEGPG